MRNQTLWKPTDSRLVPSGTNSATLFWSELQALNNTGYTTALVYLHTKHQHYLSTDQKKQSEFAVAFSFFLGGAEQHQARTGTDFLMGSLEIRPLLHCRNNSISSSKQLHPLHLQLRCTSCLRKGRESESHTIPTSVLPPWHQATWSLCSV